MGVIQIFVTVPGMKKEPILVSDTASVADFARKVFEQTGVTLFNGFGLKGQNGTYTVPVAASITKATGYDLTSSAAKAFSTYSLPTPATATGITATASGGALAANTYFTRVTYVNPAGETLASTESAGQAVILNGTLNVPSPAAKGDATGYNVYTTTTSGSAWKKQNTGAVAIGTQYVQTTAFNAGGAAVPGANTAVAPVAFSALLTDLGIAHNDELFVFNVQVGE